MALIGGGPTGSVGGISAWVQWAVLTEHLYSRELKLQVTGTRMFLQCRDTQTAGAGVACQRVTMLSKSTDGNLTLNITELLKEVNHRTELWKRGSMLIERIFKGQPVRNLTKQSGLDVQFIELSLNF